MKKILVLIVVLIMAMAVGGCAGFQKTMGLICSPTLEQQQTATRMLAALDAAQLVASGFYPIVGIVKASAILTTIKNGGCFLVTELKVAFDAVDAANQAVVVTQLKMLKGAPAALPEYKPLRKFII